MPRFYNQNGQSFETTRYSHAVPKLGLPNVSSIAKGPTNEFFGGLYADQLAELAVSHARENTDKSPADCREWAEFNLKYQKSAARDEGTEIHDLIASILKPSDYEYRQVLLKDSVVSGVRKELAWWLKERSAEGYEVDDIEFAVVNKQVGFGGRCDGRLFNKSTGRYLYIDWKSKNDTVFQRPYGIQVAAYLKSCDVPDCEAEIIIINRGTGKFTPRRMERDEIERDWKIFCDEHRAYCSRNYYPIEEILKKLLTLK